MRVVMFATTDTISVAVLSDGKADSHAQPAADELHRQDALPDHRAYPVQYRLHVRDAAAGSLRSESPRRPPGDVLVAHTVLTESDSAGEKLDNN